MSLGILNDDLNDVRPKLDLGTLKKAPFFLFSVCDRYQHEHISNRGAILADLLPLLRRRSVEYDFQYKLSEA